MLRLAVTCLIAALFCSCSRTPSVQAAHDVPGVAVAPVKTEDLSRSVVLTAEFKPFQDVDLMGCETLAELDRELGERGIRLVFGDLRDRLKRDIVRGLELALDDDDPTYPSVAAAAEAVGARSPGP